MKKGKKTISVVIAFVVFALMVGWIIWGNTALEITAVHISKSNLPTVFDGYTIAHVSDLHNTQIGESNETLLGAIENAAPDMIAVTGDLVDSRRTDIETAVSFMKKAAEIAPCYYVTGNHEARLTKIYPTLEKALVSAGVHVLRNEKMTIEKDGESITIIGLDDPNFSTLSPEQFIDEQLKADTMYGFTILLVHRPELFSAYAQKSIDLVLCGHAHGGQFRLFEQGVFAPGQGLFPKYTHGVHTNGETSMVISRGIGNSAFPFRINNRPELVLISLGAGKGRA